MFYYNILYGIVLLSFLLKGKRSDLLAWIALVLMFLMTFFRDETVGTDTQNYLMYNAEHRITEYINTYLVYLISNGALSNRGVIQILSFITYVCAALTIYRYKLTPRYFVFFFISSSLFAAGLNVSRQVTSVLLLGLFIPCIFEKKLFKSFLFFVGVILASGLHYSSLFFSVLYLFRFVNIKHESLKNSLLLFTPLFLFGIIPIDYIMQSLIPGVYREYSSSVVRNESVSLLGYGYRIGSLLLQVYLLKYFKDSKLKILYVLSVILSSSGIGMNTAVARIFMTNTLICTIGNAHIIQNIDYKKDIVGLGALIVFIVFGIYFSYSGIYYNSDLNNFEFIFKFQ